MPRVHLQPFSSLPSEGYVTVDESNSRKHQETGIIIGCAKPHRCRDPTLRPIARAIASRDEKVCTYIPAKHANNATKQTGGVLIALKDIDFDSTFEHIPFGENRQQVIFDAVLENNNVKHEAQDSTNKLDKVAERIMKEGIIIGHAKPERSRDPADPPVVRAMLNSVGAVISFIPAKDSRRTSTRSMAQIDLRNVDYVQELRDVSVREMSKVIKRMILEKRKEPVEGDRAEDKGLKAGEGRAVRPEDEQE